MKSFVPNYLVVIGRQLFQSTVDVDFLFRVLGFGALSASTWRTRGLADLYSTARLSIYSPLTLTLPIYLDFGD